LKNLERLDFKIQEKIPEITWLDFLSFLRWNYYQKKIKFSNIGVAKIIRNSHTLEPKRPFESDELINKCLNFKEEEDIHWGEWKFHLNNRIHIQKIADGGESTIKKYIEEFRKSVKDIEVNSGFILKLVNEGVSNGDNSSIKRYYDLSILPLNLLIGDKVLKYFIPPEDYLKPHHTKKADPYGIIHGVTRAKITDSNKRVLITDENKNILGSHKFSHTLLFNIDFYCPIGCSDCYKTRFGTREFTDIKFKHNFYSLDDIGEIFPPTKSQVLEQAKKTVHWMNNTLRGQQVYDVILSGGEPLYTLDNDKLRSVLNEFSHAKHLRIFRICTGSIFLGLPFRIDDELLDLLKNFTNQTGIKITFQAHLGNQHMISPESIIAVTKIRRRGIPIYSQIPIKNGINFFLEDKIKTINELIELGRKQNMIGVEPYMFIVDMHPSTNAFYVPLEPLLQVWGELVESHDYPGLERPRTLSLLFEKGNIILAGNNLLVMKKYVNKDLGYVEYHIPRVGGNHKWITEIKETFIYKEPIIEGINDDPNSIAKLKKQWEEIQ